MKECQRELREAGLSYPRVAERVVQVMNDLLAYDRHAVSSLIERRVPCNENLAGHPTCQCGARVGGYTVGLLGVLCAISNESGEPMHGPIEAVYDDGVGLVRFQVSRKATA